MLLRGSSSGSSICEAARAPQAADDSLEGLPYDSGVFDMVHIRFVGLAVPETRWAELLDEAVRVLRPGGVLEVSYSVLAPLKLTHR